MGVSMSRGYDISLPSGQRSFSNVFVACRHSWLGSLPATWLFSGTSATDLTKPQTVSRWQLSPGTSFCHSATSRAVC